MIENGIFSKRALWLIPCAAVLCVYAAIVAGLLIVNNGPGSWPMASIDFVAIWAGGHQALQTGASSAYGLSALADIQTATVGTLDGHQPFAYPPSFLFVAVPLGMLPYLPAFLIWQALTLCLFAGAIYLIVPRWEAVIVALAFPPVFWNVIDGQMALLFGALLGAALAVLDRRPVLAGILIALLTFRPQLGILIPLVLMATGRWRAFGSAAAATLCLVAVSSLFFGFDAWPSFLAYAPEQFRQVLLDSTASDNWTKLQSVYCLVRWLGGDQSLAWQVHIAVSALAALLVVWVWTRPFRYELKAASLILGAAIVNPYFFFYDLIALAVAAAFLVSDGLKHGFVRFERTAFAVIAVAGFVFVWHALPTGPAMVAVIATIIAARMRLKPGIGKSRRMAATLLPIVAGSP